MLNPRTQAEPIWSLKELFPLLAVILSLFALFVFSVVDASPSLKSKPIVRNQEPIRRVAQ